MIVRLKNTIFLVVAQPHHAPVLDRCADLRIRLQRQHLSSFLRNLIFFGQDDLSFCNPRQRLAVVPWHPLRGPGRQVLTMALQLDQIVEGVDGTQLTGVNQAHKQVADL